MSRKVLFLIIIFLTIPNLSALSYDIDTSINQEIEKKYDSNKLNQDMKVNKTSNITVPKSTPIFDDDKPNVIKVNIPASIPKANITTIAKTGIKIPSGTKFNVKSNTSVSSGSKVNSHVTFTSISAVYKSSVTIPAGTTFKGIITDSHNGQITGNGGLIKIKITSMTLNGNTVPIEGKIIKANSKNIFFNNIKGSRQYLQGVDNKIIKGVNFYKKTKTLSSKMSSNPVGAILSPIPTVTGWIGSAVCTLTSPVTGLAQKGKNISLQSGTVYEIKLTQDAYIN